MDIKKELPTFDENLEVFASVSGGKDSTAMSLYLKEQGIEHHRIFADTGWESSITTDYVMNTLPRYIGDIEVVRNGYLFPDLCRKKGMFPSRLIRFCTEFLKVKPILLHIEEQSKSDQIINAIGIRSSESKSRSTLGEYEFNYSTGLWVWRPILSWTVGDVVAIHKRHGVPLNTLYAKGAERVGCWPCIFSRKKEIRLIVDIDKKRIDLIRTLESEIAELAKQRYAKKGETFESLGYHPPTFFRSHSVKNKGMIPIDDVVQWSRTSHGGKQFTLFDDNSRSLCARWGFCET